MKKLAVALLLSALACATDKPRAWQTGKLLDTERTRVLTGTRSERDYSSPSGQRSQAECEPIDTYAIEGATYSYVVQELRNRFKPTIRPPKPANVTVNGEVRYAVEKDKLFFVDEDGKEHQTAILKKILREASSPK